MRRKKKISDEDIEFIEIDLDDETGKHSTADYFGNDMDDEEYDLAGEEDFEDGDSLSGEDDVEEEKDLSGEDDMEEENGLSGEDDVEDGYDLAEEDADEEDFIEEDSADHDLDELDEKETMEKKVETEAEQKFRKHNRKKKAAIIAGGIVGALAAVYIGFAVFFSSHFMFNTSINEVDFSTKSVAQVEEYMKGQVADYELVLEEADGTSENISGAEISLEYVPGDELEKLVKKQDNFLWIRTLWKPEKIEAPVGVQYDEAALETKINGLACLVPENQTMPVDAHPEFQGTEFVVVPEVIGTQIDTEKFKSVVAEAINGFRHTVDLFEESCYILPRFKEDSEEVINAKDAMNSYLGACITYDFNPYTEVVDSSVISQWVTVDGDMNVTFNQDAVRGYVASLAEKYDTKRKTRDFTTANGNVVSVQPGTYGWEIDQETEYNTLTANIQNAEVVTRAPAYLSTAASHDAMDMGNTYAEVDLTAQHMWMIQNGQVVFQAPVVTGNPNISGRATPSGVYSILELESPSILVGEKDPKTGQPEYRTKVTYWMRVTWSGIGFHDATWQSSFGGSRYLTNGSHGCINMSYNDAGTLYGMLSVGTPVVIHY